MEHHEEGYWIERDRGNEDEEESKKLEKPGKSRLASLAKLGSWFKKEKPEKAIDIDAPPPEDPKKSALSNLLKS